MSLDRLRTLRRDIPKKAEEIIEREKQPKTKKPKFMTSTKEKPKPSKEISTARVIALFGKQGSGKTYSALSHHRFGNMLYIDLEGKAEVIKNEKFPSADVNIVNLRVVNQKYEIDKLATIKQFKENLPNWIKHLESGTYKVCVVDNCRIFRPYGKFEWLRRNPKRVRPQPYEWGEIEEIVQECLMPLINCCRRNDIYLILVYGIKDLYLNDVIIGTTEDAKQWLLGEIDVEVWLEWDYKKYILKHPYKPFWEYQDEDEFLADYIYDSEFIDENALFKDYQQFKEETLISEQTRKELKRVREQTSIALR